MKTNGWFRLPTNKSQLIAPIEFSFLWNEKKGEKEISPSIEMVVSTWNWLNEPTEQYHHQHRCRRHRDQSIISMNGTMKFSQKKKEKEENGNDNHHVSMSMRANARKKSLNEN